MGHTDDPDPEASDHGTDEEGSASEDGAAQNARIAAGMIDRLLISGTTGRPLSAKTKKYAMDHCNIVLTDDDLTEERWPMARERLIQAAMVCLNLAQKPTSRKRRRRVCRSAVTLEKLCTSFLERLLIQ